MASGHASPGSRTSPAGTAGGEHPARAAYRRRWIVTFVLLVALGAAWSLVTPPGAGPDEPAHAIKAAAIVGGELTGDPYPRIGGGAREVEAPALLDGIDPTCFVFHPEVSAECRPTYEGPTGDEEMPTTAGVSPPAYYALVGAPIRLVRSLEGVYLARLVSGMIAAAFVATAVQLAAAARSRFMVAALAASWTPMAASLSGVLNPSALEVSAALLVWVAGLLLVRPHALPTWLERRLIWHFAVASALFALSRHISPPLLAVMVLVIALAAPWPRLREVLLDRRTRIAAGIVVVVTAFASWWLAIHPVGEVTARAATAVGGRDAVSTSLGYLGVLYEQAIGIFGWLDTVPPMGVVLAWTVAIGVLAVVGAALATRRLVLALVAITGATVAVPAVLAAVQMPEYGIVFQGRYVLPLGAGIVIVAGRAVDEAGDELVARLSRALGVVLALTAIAHLVSIWFAARRFAVTIHGPVFFIGEGWNPGVSLAVPLALAVVAAPAFAFWCWWTPLVAVPAGATDGPAEPGDRSSREDTAAGEAGTGPGDADDGSVAAPARIGP